MSYIGKIISGGQTGADRGGLQAALDQGLPHGGWCPKGRQAEDGTVPGRFMLTETDETDHRVRTDLNVLDGDATVIFCHGIPQGGTALTLELCRKRKKPFFLIDLAADDDQHIAESVRTFAASIGSVGVPIVLNVAGSRESVSPSIYERTYTIISKALQLQKESRPSGWRRIALSLLPIAWVAVAALVFSAAEISFESARPWAPNALPDWSQAGSVVSDIIFHGNVWHAYHGSLLAFILLAFHLPHFFAPRISLQNEVRILALILLFLLCADVTWIMIANAAGITSGSPEVLSSHRLWIAGSAADGILFAALAAILYTASGARLLSIARRHKSS